MTVDLTIHVSHVMHAVRTAVNHKATAHEVRAMIRGRSLDHHMFYVYVLDDDDRLVGQVSARQLLVSDDATPIERLMTHPAAVVYFHERVETAFAILADYRQLAVPVVDDQHHLLGVVDVTAWVADASDRLTHAPNEFFGRLGAAVDEHRAGGTLTRFRRRMPLLLCNIVSGLLCAVIVERHDLLLLTVVTVAGFIPLVLTVSESIGVQAMDFSLHLLQSDPSPTTFRRRFGKEFVTSLLLAVTCGLIVGVTALFLASGGERLGMVITLVSSITGAMVAAACIGALVPRLIRLAGGKPRAASGSLTLMLVDIVCTATYLAIASLIFAPRVAAAVNSATTAVP